MSVNLLTPDVGEASMTRTQSFRIREFRCRNSGEGIFEFWQGRGNGISVDTRAISDDTARTEKPPPDRHPKRRGHSQTTLIARQKGN
jgi:hypothetical protein